MHADSYFVTGKAHSVCQDYAFASSGILPFGIVSDGCSSSPLTDIGSRLLTHALVREIPALRIKCDTDLIVRVAAAARSTAIALGLPMECLDATLLCCSAWYDGVKVAAIGDGVIACRKSSGDIEAWHIEYNPSAPEYASYRMDPRRLERFYTEFGSLKQITELSGNTTKMTDSFIFQLDIDDAEVVAVMSDGACSFEGLQWRDVVYELMSFKSTNGQFVQRRMKRFIKNCQKDGITPYDDVSMAAVCLA